MHPYFAKYRFEIALLLSWVLAVALVNPTGDFPLNDDFSFAKSVFNLCEEGRFLLDDWLAMTLVSQLLYGVLWCEVFGFSFEVLRYSTLFMALLALLLCFRFLRMQGVSGRSSFFITLVLAFNPLFFSLSFTFMTDVHYLAWMMAALLVWVRYLRSGGEGVYGLALLLTLVLVFLRQTGLMVALAAGVAILVSGRWTLRTALKAALPLVLAAGLLVLWYRWLASHQGLPATFGQPGKLFENLTDSAHLASLPQRAAVLIAYLGLFTLPLTLGFFPKLRLPGTPARQPWRLAVVVIYLLVAWFCRSKIPWGNLLYNFGLGPPTLKDGQFFLNLDNQLGAWGLLVLQLLFILAGAWFLWCTTGLPRRLARSAEGSLLLTAALAYLAFLMLDTHAFDRYFLVLLPLVLFYVSPVCPAFSFGKKWPVAPWAALLLLAAFSLAGTHDYLSWNRARWAALNKLTVQQSIPPEKIDGGFEFNGWYRPGRIEHGRAKSWWWVADDEYCVTFGPLDGYQCVERVPFMRWLPPGVDSLCILKKR